jgi:16S rRNA processing protein RimM
VQSQYRAEEHGGNGTELSMSERDRDADLVLIGTVVSVNFPKRQLRVRCETDHPERFLDMPRITLESAAGNLKRFDVEGIELLEEKAVITVARRYREEEIAFAKKARVVVREEERHPLDDDEHYVDDLIGMRVVDTSGRLLGRLHAVYRTGANDVYEVLDDQGQEHMVPAVEESIVNVDTANGVLTLDPQAVIETTDEN